MTNPNIYVHFDKIEKCIESCKTYTQLMCTVKMIHTFSRVFSKNKSVSFLRNELDNTESRQRLFV
jgi:hypothetical protein